jgi:hypothetical protein
MHTCSICALQFMSRIEDDLCLSCRTMSPDVRLLLLEMKQSSGPLTSDEIARLSSTRITPALQLNEDALTYVLPALVNSGKLTVNNGTYALPHVTS